MSPLMSQYYSHIRDPLHGVIYISAAERAVIETPAFQRLRTIKQLGFADFAFPGATHTRFSHSLGAMNFAGVMFDKALAGFSWPEKERARFRQAVRLAALLHDIGHPPLSHTTEMLMPSKNALFNDDIEAQASHEDYTLKIILASHVATTLESHFPDIPSAMIAALIDKKKESDFFRVEGLDLAPLLRQIISSEIDADRMDYLLRDSFFGGVNYGKFDSDWLIENLIHVEHESKLYLGIKARAIFALEDFLLSRAHMFASVYFHHTPVIMEEMLKRYFKECPEDFVLPHDIEEYVRLDDMDLWQALRKSRNQWAQAIVLKKPYVLLEEFFPHKSHDQAAEKTLIEKRLAHAGIEYISTSSKTIFSKPCLPLFIKESNKPAILLEQFSSLFSRYEVPAQIDRIFVKDRDVERAEHALKVSVG